MLEISRKRQKISARRKLKIIIKECQREIAQYRRRYRSIYGSTDIGMDRIEKAIINKNIDHLGIRADNIGTLQWLLRVTGPGVFKMNKLSSFFRVAKVAKRQNSRIYIDSTKYKHQSTADIIECCDLRQLKFTSNDDLFSIQSLKADANRELVRVGLFGTFYEQ